jgi:hypothetical protein
MRTFLALSLVVAGCGSSNPSGDKPDASMSGGGIPAPGTTDKVDQAFDSVEPNDSPDTATPLGVAATNGVYVWVDTNTTTATDSSDYFVFESGTTDGTFQLGSSGLCFGSGITAMTVTLWKVVAGAEVNPPVDTWTMSGATGGCVTGTTPITANTEYLLGVMATGAGTYSA